MAHVTICTPQSELIEMEAMDDHAASVIVERFTVAFGKRGGLWVAVPHQGSGDGTSLRWIPSTSEITIIFDGAEVPEKARRLSLNALPSPALHVKTSVRPMH